MDRHDFETLRKCLGKEIKADIQFVRDRHLDEDVLVFDGAVLENPLEMDIVLNSSYNRETKGIKYNFVLRGVGPICRVEVNSVVHGDAGRTHKHDLQDPSDPRKHLPHAVARPDLEGKGPREVWELLCRHARIDHTGTFTDPTVEN